MLFVPVRVPAISQGDRQGGDQVKMRPAWSVTAELGGNSHNINYWIRRDPSWLH